MTADIAVTGATGGVGGRVAGRLAARDVPHRLVVRDPARAPARPGIEVRSASYGDAEAMRAALDGIRTLFLVSASESADRVQQHLTAVDAAVAAGVERIVYLSFYGAAADATFTLARHHWLTEERIRASGVEFTFLRDNLYLDFLPYMVGPDGVIRGPAGDGRFAGVTRDDIADCAVEVLLDRVHNGTTSNGTESNGMKSSGTTRRGETYDLTGPVALTMAEAADILATAAGRNIHYEPETLAEAYASRAHYGAPDWEVEGWVTSYAAIAAGELAEPTDHVARLAGHPPMSLAEQLAADPDAVQILQSRGAAG